MCIRDRQAPPGRRRSPPPPRLRRPCSCRSPGPCSAPASTSYTPGRCTAPATCTNRVGAAVVEVDSGGVPVGPAMDPGSSQPVGTDTPGAPGSAVQVPPGAWPPALEARMLQAPTATTTIAATAYGTILFSDKTGMAAE